MRTQIIKAWRAAKWFALALVDWYAFGIGLMADIVRERIREGNKGHHEDIGL